MPLPNPRKDEDKNSFISRCMSNETMKSEFPDQKQRTAVCFSQWRKGRKKDSEPLMTKQCINFVSKHYEIEKEEGTKERYIEVPISGLKEDRDGEKMSQTAINKMIDSLKKGIVLHSDHGKGPIEYSWKDIQGVSVDGWQNNDLLIAKFRLNKSHPDHELLWNYIHKEKMPVGFSIGARPKQAHYEKIE